MSLNASTEHSLGRVFRTGFIVHDIAEPIVSFDDWTPANTVGAWMASKKFEVVGIRRDGRVAGYLEHDSLGEGTCAAYVQPFHDSQVILDSTSIADLVPRLKNQRRLFVSILGRVGGIVSRTDLEKPPVRMWLFGMVTLIEMRFTSMIERFCPNESWRQFLSEARLQKAEQLLAERLRRNQHLDLLGCIQFSDKGQILARNPTLRARTDFQSRRQIEDTFKRLERLRNNLAHSQDIIESDWDTIVILTENLDRVLEGPPERETDDAASPPARETTT